MSPIRPESVQVSCPNRIDLAGGTIDLYPIYLLLGQATTVNLAVTLSSSASVSLIDDDLIHIESVDLGASGVLEPGQVPDSGPLALAARAVRRFWSGGGLSVRMQNEAPRGSGLGASSALLVALARAVSELDGLASNPHQLIGVLSEVEAGLLGIPTGRQDYYAAYFGGLQRIEFSAGRVRRQDLALSRRVHGWFSEGLVVAFTGEAHFSGKPNWEVIKAAVDGEPDTLRRLHGIQDAAIEAAEALEEGNWDRLCEAVRTDWSHRQELHPEVTSPRLDQLVQIALDAGAEASKLCGAGGGGSLMALCAPEKTEQVRQALARYGAEPLDLAIDRNGCILKLSPNPHGG